MANIWEKAISILAGNLNSGLSYLITTVTRRYQVWKRKDQLIFLSWFQQKYLSWWNQEKGWIKFGSRSELNYIFGKNYPDLSVSVYNFGKNYDK